MVHMSILTYSVAKSRNIMQELEEGGFYPLGGIDTEYDLYKNNEPVGSIDLEKRILKTNVYSPLNSFVQELGLEPI